MRLWDAATGQLLQKFSQQSNDINDVAFSSDGKLIVSASSDRTIGLWQQPVNFLPLNKLKQVTEVGRQKSGDRSQ